MKKQHLLFLALLCASSSAYALDGEYVVMGGFTTIVNAFTRLKLMFNDNEYKTMILNRQKADLSIWKQVKGRWASAGST